jgi:hypothetical protein|tara:strand:- start:643 stop:888 length:246 start_codon:yes stop_codon:yes gene_type:complete
VEANEEKNSTITDQLQQAHEELQSKPCTCGCCKKGMSKTGAECFDRMAEAHKAIRGGLKGIDWKPVFRNMYPKEEQHADHS